MKKECNLMKSLKNSVASFFGVSKGEGKPSRKFQKRRLTALLLALIVALAGSTYAWFTSAGIVAGANGRLTQIKIETDGLLRAEIAFDGVDALTGFAIPVIGDDGNLVVNYVPIGLTPEAIQIDLQNIFIADILSAYLGHSPRLEAGSTLGTRISWADARVLIMDSLTADQLLRYGRLLTVGAPDIEIIEAIITELNEYTFRVRNLGDEALVAFDVGDAFGVKLATSAFMPSDDANNDFPLDLVGFPGNHLFDDPLDVHRDYTWFADWRRYLEVVRDDMLPAAVPTGITAALATPHTLTLTRTLANGATSALENLFWEGYFSDYLPALELIDDLADLKVAIREAQRSGSIADAIAVMEDIDDLDVSTPFDFEKFFNIAIAYWKMNDIAVSMNDAASRGGEITPGIDVSVNADGFLVVLDDGAFRGFTPRELANMDAIAENSDGDPSRNLGFDFSFRYGDVLTKAAADNPLLAGFVGGIKGIYYNPAPAFDGNIVLHMGANSSLDIVMSVDLLARRFDDPDAIFDRLTVPVINNICNIFNGAIVTLGNNLDAGIAVVATHPIPVAFVDVAGISWDRDADTMTVLAAAAPNNVVNAYMGAIRDPIGWDTFTAP
jgi:hypothetical protein